MDAYAYNVFFPSLDLPIFCIIVNGALTIRQIASLAGVSRTTVSMALRNHPRISEETRQKIMAIAQKHNYIPDPVVSTLMNKLRVSRKQRFPEKLAYLTFWDTPDNWKTNINERLYFAGASERALALGYDLEPFWASEPGINGARLSKILFSRGIRGVIIAPLVRPLGHVSLDWKHFACAAIGLTVIKTNLHRATHNYLEGMTLVLRNLRHRGYERIGFANSAEYNRRVNRGWLSGFLTYQYTISKSKQVPPLLVNGWIGGEAFRLHQERRQPLQEKMWNRKNFAQWMEKWKPDVVVSSTDHAYVLAESLGYRIPKDLGFVQLHRFRDTDPWAGIDRLPELIGAAATDLVVGQLLNNEVGSPPHPKSVLINGVWRDGPSIRRAEASRLKVGPSQE